VTSGGYQTSTDDMAGVASKVSGEVGPIGDEADAIGKSQVSGSDGGRDFQDKATAYANALKNNVIASIKAYGTATTTLGDKLTDTYQQYGNTEQANTSTVTKSGAGA
jgi:hypothetical protein